MKRLAVLVLFLFACKEEKPIIMKFEPNDLTAKPTVAATTDAAPTSSPAASPSPSPSPTPSPSPKTQAKAGECRTAADCAVVPAECCDCANGGTQTAIPRAQLASHQAARKKKCAKTLCTQVFSTDPTCGQKADCVEGKCAMK